MRSAFILPRDLSCPFDTKGSKQLENDGRLLAALIRHSAGSTHRLLVCIKHDIQFLHDKPTKLIGRVIPSSNCRKVFACAARKSYPWKPSRHGQKYHDESNASTIPVHERMDSCQPGMNIDHNFNIMIFA